MQRAYNRALVEHLMPAVWDRESAYGMRNPYAPDLDMPKAKGNPKIQSPLPAHLADIHTAWRKTELTKPERQALFLHYAVDMTQTGAAKLLGLPKRTVCAQIDRGIGKVTAYLNGDEYVDGYDAAADIEGDVNQ